MMCGKDTGKSKNNKDRGPCKHLKGHQGKCGSGTCPGCAVKLSRKNTHPSIYESGSGRCRKCNLDYWREKTGAKPRTPQVEGTRHIFPFFPCGCSGVLEKKPNKFAVPSRSNWGCRISRILQQGLFNAIKNKYKPIDPKTPHSVIRKLMDEKRCWRCGKNLDWKIKPGHTPHLHHEHGTGKILGFVHAHCNTAALEKEIDELKSKLSKYEIKI